MVFVTERTLLTIVDAPQLCAHSVGAPKFVDSSSVAHGSGTARPVDD